MVKEKEKDPIAETTYSDYVAIIRKKNGFSIWVQEFFVKENGDVVCIYTTKEGKQKKLTIAKDQIAEIEENA